MILPLVEEDEERDSKAAPWWIILLHRKQLVSAQVVGEEGVEPNDIRTVLESEV